jgi:hypothetical protein
MTMRPGAGHKSPHRSIFPAQSGLVRRKKMLLTNNLRVFYRSQVCAIRVNLIAKQNRYSRLRIRVERRDVAIRYQIDEPET